VGRALPTERDAFAAVDELHAKGIRWVVVTSGRWAASGAAPTITVLGSQRLGMSCSAPTTEATALAFDMESVPALCRAPTIAPDRSPKRFRIEIPQLDEMFTGTGDLTAALLLAWTARAPGQLQAATERVVASVQAVLQRTYAAYCLARQGRTFATTAEEQAFRRRELELRLIESKADLEAPEIRIHAQPVP